MKFWNVNHKRRKAATARKEAAKFKDGMGWQRAGKPMPKKYLP